MFWVSLHRHRGSALCNLQQEPWLIPPENGWVFWPLCLCFICRGSWRCAGRKGAGCSPWGAATGAWYTVWMLKKVPLVQGLLWHQLSVPRPLHFIHTEGRSPFQTSDPLCWPNVASSNFHLHRLLKTHPEPILLIMSSFSYLWLHYHNC